MCKSVMYKLLGICVVSSLILFSSAPRGLPSSDVGCAPEDKDQYAGVDCAACHGPGADWDTLCGAFNPEKAIRIVYENPQGCDEVSGTITLKASVQGEGAPVPAAMKYELRTEEEGTPTVLTGNAPTYEVGFDTTTLRDGFVYYTVTPLDVGGDVINIKAPPHNAPGFLPDHRGFMVNNNLDLSKPLIVIGSVLYLYGGPFTGWTADQLRPHIMFGYNFSEHMRGLGYFPESCFYDDTTIVFDPSDPMTDEPSTVIDVMGNMVTGTVTLNPGNLCLGSPFWEIAVPNGLDDIVEHFAWGGVRSTVNRSPEHVNATPHVIEFYDEIVERLTNDYNHVNDWYSTYVYKEPVPYGEPIHRLKEILKELVKTRGITSILLFSNYHRSTDFEMSGNAWPNFQEAVDEINTELGTSIGLGSIANNDYRLIDYESFLRSQFLTLWELVKSSNVPPGKKVALMGAGHGSGSTSRLYDVSRLQSPIQEQVIEDYINERLSSIYPTDTPFRIDYSEYSNSLTDGARGVGEQVWQWVNEGYDYIFIYPMEWPWGSGETWRGLRGSAVELVDPENTEIFVSDSRIRGETLVNGVTRIIVGETIFEQVPYNPVPYHYYRASNVQLLEDKMIALTGAPEPQLVSGTLSIRGEDVNLSLDFSDSLLINESNMTLQNAAVRGMVTRLNKLINGVLDNEDMAMYVFALLAENAIDVESVEVEWGKMRLREGREGSLRGSVTALATAKIGGRDTRLFAVIRIR